MMPHIRTVRAKSHKIELYRAALVYCGPLKKTQEERFSGPYSFPYSPECVEGEFSEDEMRRPTPQIRSTLRICKG
jgi:hypothetical protein